MGNVKMASVKACKQMVVEENKKSKYLGIL